MGGGGGQYPGRHYEGLSGRPKELAGLRFTRGISTQVDTVKDYLQKKLFKRAEF